MKINQKLLQLLVFILPFQVGLHFWPSWSYIFGVRVDYLSPTLYLVDLVMLLYFLFFFYEVVSIKILLNKYKKHLIILVSFALVNILNAELWQISAFRWIMVAKLFIFFVTLTYQPRLRDLIRKPLILSLNICFIVALLQVVCGRTVGGPLYLLGERSFTVNTPGISLMRIDGVSYLRGYATFPHPNVYAGFVLLSLSLLSFRPKSVFSLTAGLGLLLAASKGAFLAMFAAIGLVLTRIRHRGLLFLLCLILIIVSVIVFLLPVNSTDLSIKERSDLMRLAIDNLSPLGVGLGNGVLLASRFINQPVHNIFVLTLLETGPIGLAFLLWVLYKALLRPKSIVIVMVILITGVLDHYWISFNQTAVLLTITLSLLLDPRSK